MGLSMEPVIDFSFGVVGVSSGVGDFAPIVGITAKQEIVTRRHTDWYGFHRIKSGNSQGSGLITFDTIRITIRVDRLQRACGTVLGLGEGGIAVGRGQGGNKIASIIGELRGN